MSEKTLNGLCVDPLWTGPVKFCEFLLAKSTFEEILQLVRELFNNGFSCIPILRIQLRGNASSIMATLRRDCKKLHKTWVQLSARSLNLELRGPLNQVKTASPFKFPSIKPVGCLNGYSAWYPSGWMKTHVCLWLFRFKRKGLSS